MLTLNLTPAAASVRAKEREVLMITNADLREPANLACWPMPQRGPVLLLANFDGTFPGLVGMLCMAGTLSSLGKNVSRLWSENFDNAFFEQGVATWLRDGALHHSTHYLRAILPTRALMATSAGQIGQQTGEYILRHKAIIGLFDTLCIGMLNGVFPVKAMVDAGMPLESLSQSALLVEMDKVPQALRESCLQWYEQHGMTFHFGTRHDQDLTREQVLEQCAMLIVLARFVKQFGLGRWWACSISRG